MVRSRNTEVWESINDTWLEFSKKSTTPLDGNNLRSLFDWVRERSLQFHGARAPCCEMMRLRYPDGHLSERGDNTARILDVVPHPASGPRSCRGNLRLLSMGLDFRAVAAHRSYRHLYCESYRPWLIAESWLYSRNAQVACCLPWRTKKTLVSLAEIYGHQQECHRLSGQMHAELAFGRTIFFSKVCMNFDKLYRPKLRVKWPNSQDFWCDLQPKNNSTGTYDHCFELYLKRALCPTLERMLAWSWSTYCKMHHFEEDEERIIVLLSSGNLALTQAVFHRDTSSNGKSNEDLKKKITAKPKGVGWLIPTEELVGDAVRAVFACCGKVRYTYSSMERLQSLSAADRRDIW